MLRMPANPRSWERPEQSVSHSLRSNPPCSWLPASSQQEHRSLQMKSPSTRSFIRTLERIHMNPDLTLAGERMLLVFRGDGTMGGGRDMGAVL